MKVNTPIGSLEAIEVISSDENPGIWIRVNGEDLVLVEYDITEGKHVIWVWNHKQPDLDPEYKQIIDEYEK